MYKIWIFFTSMKRNMQAWKFGRNECFDTASFPLLIKDSNDNLFPRLIYITQMLFLKIYKLHFLHNDLPMLHKQAGFSATIQPLSNYLECSPTRCIVKNKQCNNKTCPFFPTT